MLVCLDSRSGDPEREAEWERYASDADLSISLAADSFQRVARSVMAVRHISFTTALAMVYETITQRIELGDVDAETGFSEIHDSGQEEDDVSEILSLLRSDRPQRICGLM